MPETNHYLELSHDFLSEAKSTGQHVLVQNLLVAAGKAILAGQIVFVKKSSIGHDLYLTSFQDYADWLNREHMDVLER
jgi:hypothetical protein